MSLLRFLGLGGSGAGRDAEPASLVELGAALDSMEPAEARLSASIMINSSMIAWFTA